MEQQSRDYSHQHKLAVERATQERNEWMLSILGAMNPKKMTPAERESVDLYLY